MANQNYPTSKYNFFFRSRDLRVEKSAFHQHVDQSVVLSLSSIDQVVQILLRKNRHTQYMPSKILRQLHKKKRKCLIFN